MMVTRSAWRADTRTAAYVRILLWIGLAIGEMLVVSVLYDLPPGPDQQSNPAFYVTRAARWAALAVPLFVLLAWTERQRLAEQWTALQSKSFIGWPLAANVVAFASAATTSATFTMIASSSPTPPWHLVPLLGVLLMAMALTLVRMVIPFNGLGTLISNWRYEAVFASIAALAVVVLADAATKLWDNMAGATLLLAAEILKLYETNVVVDMAEQGIRVGNFGVQVWASCSGFEGLALVAGFVTVYLWAFRHELRFPRALVLYPIGLAASWLLNAVRIAALTSIGAHVSPEMAVKGFHSQGGWIAFLAIALGLMALSRRFGLAAARPAKAGHGAGALLPAAKAGLPTRYDATVTYLAPFVALMVGSIAMSVAAPHDRPVYALKAGLVAVALWQLRHRLGSWRPALPGTSIAAGLLVGIAWIATAPSGDSGSDLGTWLAEIGTVMAVAWLAVRALGTIVLVPIAEELAFRGYLYRRLIRRDFHLVGWTAFSWLALIVSSVAFGALHERWLAGTLAGAMFALLMLRGGRLGDAVAAHAIANALIFAWALAFQQWSLL